MAQNEQLHNMRHSCAHLLAAAVQELWPEVKLGVGPVIEYGCYYDFDLEHRITEEDFPAIEAKMTELKEQGLGYEREELSIAEAKDRARGMNQPYKVELIEAIETTGSTAVDGGVSDPSDKPSTVSFYTTGTFVDLCRGGHVESTKEIGAFKILSAAGAYWRGDEKNPMMQRLYVACFATQAELDEYLAQLEEAKKRDHRKLGKELDLFVFSDLVGPGLPMLLPKGATVKNLLEQFITQEKKARNYQFVWIPHMAKAALYEKSGHLGKYDAMLPRMADQHGDEYVMKPMNCPHHFELYRSRPHSYRELPYRIAENTTVYRNEKSGELAGLLRVKSLTQDDTHHVVRHDQIKDEIEMVLGLMQKVYTTLGFSDFRVQISIRDSKNLEKYFGHDELWAEAEQILVDAVKAWGVEYVVEEGEAAFYGPKIDIMVKDTIGRMWQLTTVQLDFWQPENFDMTYAAEDGSQQRPAVLHVAIYGSFERFMGVLIEHYAGKFPIWLASVQVKLLPIADRHLDYATDVKAQLEKAGYRVELDDRPESVGKKIRAAQLEQVPYMLVVGDKELEAKQVAVRSRDQGDLGVESVEELMQRLAAEPNPLAA